MLDAMPLRNSAENHAALMGTAALHIHLTAEQPPDFVKIVPDLY